MKGEERRKQLLNILSSSNSPVSGGTLSKELDVSRQIIVGDVALLRAGGARITATPRGYVLERPPEGRRFTIACRHTPEEMARELEIMVDNGCTVENVIVEHSVYGQLVGQLMLSSRYDVAEFIRKVSESGSKPLSDLTGGIHLHTLRCPDESAFGRVTAELREAGYLLE